MRVRCASADLRDAILDIVGRGPRGSELQTYSVTLNAADGRLHIAATGLGTSLGAAIDADVDEEGIVMVSIGGLLAVSLKLPRDESAAIEHGEHDEHVRFVTSQGYMLLHAVSSDDEVLSAPSPAGVKLEPAEPRVPDEPPPPLAQSQPAPELEPEAEPEPQPEPELEHEVEPEPEWHGETPQAFETEPRAAPRVFRRAVEAARVGGPTSVAIGASLLLLVLALLPFSHAFRVLSLIAAGACAALVPIVDAKVRRHGDMLELGVVIGLAYLVLFPVRALVVLLDLDPNENPYVDSLTPHQVTKALSATTIALLVGSIAYVVPVGDRLARRRPAWLTGRTQLAIPRWSGPAAFVVGFSAQLVIVLARTGNLIGSRLHGRGAGVVAETSALMLIGLCLLTLDAVHRRRPHSLAILIAATSAGVLASFAGQFKEIGILAILVPLIMWTLVAPGWIGYRRIAAAAVLLLVLFVGVQIWRHASIRIASNNPALVAQEIPREVIYFEWVNGYRRGFEPWTPIREGPVVVSDRLTGFDTFSLAVADTGTKVPFQHGAVLWNLLAGVVPRVVWPGKPEIGIGYWYASWYWTPPGVEIAPQAVTHPGSLWIDFGWIGMIVGMAILGGWYRFTYAFLSPRRSEIGAVVYTVLFVTVIVVDRDIPLVYVTLLQRMAVLALVLAGLRLAARRGAKTWEAA